MGHDIHHYVPAFLLKQWHAGTSQKLTQFSRLNDGSLFSMRYKAKSVAKMHGLYGLRNNRHDPNVVERDFMGPALDEPAAVAHQKMLSDGVAGMAVSDKLAWAKLIVSFLYRHPETVERNRLIGADLLREELRKVGPDFDQLQLEHPLYRAYSSPLHFVEEHAATILDDMANRLMPKMVQNVNLNKVLLTSIWGVRELRDSSVNLLIGDKPVQIENSLAQNFCLFVPISPTKTFIAFNSGTTLPLVENISSGKLVRAINGASVRSASSYVYATDNAQAGFVDKYLRR